MKQQQDKSVKVSKTRVLRAIAGSTAIETGQPVKEIEDRLKRKHGRYKDLPLAL